MNELELFSFVRLIESYEEHAHERGDYDDDYYISVENLKQWINTNKYDLTLGALLNILGKGGKDEI